MLNYAEKIREYRERKFITQKQLADILDVSLISVVRWENGKNQPTMAIKKKLCDLFKQEGIKTFED